MNPDPGPERLQAARLETNTKELGVNVLISEDTWKLVKDAVVTKPVKEITVKGRKQPVMTYEVLGLKGEAPIDGESAKGDGAGASTNEGE